MHFDNFWYLSLACLQVPTCSLRPGLLWRTHHRVRMQPRKAQGEGRRNSTLHGVRNFWRSMPLAASSRRTISSRQTTLTSRFGSSRNPAAGGSATVQKSTVSAFDWSQPAGGWVRHSTTSSIHRGRNSAILQVQRLSFAATAHGVRQSPLLRRFCSAVVRWRMCVWITRRMAPSDSLIAGLFRSLHILTFSSCEYSLKARLRGAICRRVSSKASSQQLVPGATAAVLLCAPMHARLRSTSHARP
mmetsp:Transcript_14168/g.25261  ORF Transcript_14168/g.25261 Transcript_14168/m.25261 type:complete len:244 (+) Transcript_14168:1314-2045(+)